MNPSEFPLELATLCEAICEDRLSTEDAARLEELLQTPAARRFYLSYLDLHGTLYWDAASGGEPVAGRLEDAFDELPLAVATREEFAASRRLFLSRKLTAKGRAGLVAACCLLMLFCWQARGLVPWFGPDTPEDSLAQNSDAQSDHRSRDIAQNTPAVVDRLAPEPVDPPNIPGRQPVRLDSIASQVAEQKEKSLPASTDREQATHELQNAIPPKLITTNSPAAPLTPVEFINLEIRKSWEAAQIEPSPRAAEGEWLRRLWLDLVGHVPPLATTESFLADQSTDKRSRMIAQLLKDPASSENMATIWSRLLIGRRPGPQVDREAFDAYLQNSFATGRGWDAIVADLVSAEGLNSEQGETNFLLAHLNNEAVPATAITARVLLGEQIQCTQCHHHPFNDSRQASFWEFNSFFQQTAAVPVMGKNPATGREERVGTRLVTEEVGGPIYYETLNGLMRAAFPRYEGHEIDPSGHVNRRRELARLMTSGSRPQVAIAFVNRMWQHFLGASFTLSPDDFGPHNPPTHPALLAGLSERFVASGYDVKQLAQWICESEPYQLTSRYGKSNQTDDPAAGEHPLFSRVYVKPMTAEQLYDSLRVATRTGPQAQGSRQTQRQQRREWVDQFVVAFGTEENDEASTFDGTITQALNLMNGELIEEALQPRSGTMLGDLLEHPASDVDRIRQLCLAVLARQPTPDELAGMRKVIRLASQRANRPTPPAVEGYQDVLWALLNSNEFSLIH